MTFDEAMTRILIFLLAAAVIFFVGWLLLAVAPVLVPILVVAGIMVFVTSDLFPSVLIVGGSVIVVGVVIVAGQGVVEAEGKIKAAKREDERAEASARELEKLSRLSTEDLRFLMKGSHWNPKDFLTEADYDTLMDKHGLPPGTSGGSAKYRGICPECRRKVVLTPRKGQVKSHITGGERCPGMGRVPVRVVSGEEK